MSLIFCASCQYNVKHAHPEFIDADRGYARVYNFVDAKNPQCGEPKYVPEYSGKNIPISEMSGHVCLKTSEAQEIIRYYNEYIKKNANCP